MTDHRRLSDRILEAHKLACEAKRRDVADILLRALELELQALGRFEGEHRRSLELQETAFVLHRDTFPGSHP